MPNREAGNKNYYKGMQHLSKYQQLKIYRAAAIQLSANMQILQNVLAGVMVSIMELVGGG